MQFLLRQSPSGENITADSNGEVVIWDAALGTWKTDRLDSDQVANVSGVPGTSVSDALDNLQASIPPQTGGVLGLATVSVPGGVVDMNWSTGTTPGQYAQADAPVGPNNGLIWNGSPDFQIGTGINAGAIEFIGTGSRQVLVVCAASLLPNAWNVDAICGLVMAINNDLVGAATASIAALEAGASTQLLHAGVLSPTDGPTSFNGTSQRRVEMTPGDVIRPLVSNPGAATMQALGLTISVFLVSSSP